MRGYRNVALALLFVPLLAGGCQLVAGIDDIELGSNETPDSGSVDAPIDSPPIEGGPKCVGRDVESPLLPVDIIWMVDTTGSMTAILPAATTGIQRFASVMGTQQLDYRVIMLAPRGKASNQVCVPPPLAGDTNCGNGPRFFHSNLNIQSRDALTIFMNTLKTPPAEPWGPQVRAASKKLLVIVTDDDSEVTATAFEGDPTTGILRRELNNAFDDYSFNGMYGWGSETNPTTRCTYPADAGGIAPAASGTVYTELVTKTKGVRGKICDPNEWNPFIDRLTALASSSRSRSCMIDVPGGNAELEKVTVAIKNASGITPIPRVPDAGGCTQTGGFWVDTTAAAPRAILCAPSCKAMRDVLTLDRTTKLQFGCGG
jgi:hypothetical protein